MAKRIATILAPQDLDTAGTKVIDVNIQDQISQIDIIWTCTNVTVSVMLDAVTACLSKVELVDGSEVLASVSGAELQGINFYDKKKLLHHKIGLTVGDKFELKLSLGFGRWLWDDVFAFLPKNFVNPQLKITWDEDACNTAVVVNSCQVYAYVDDAPAGSPIGMLVNREIKSYAMAASSHDYTDLPVDRVLRRIILRGYTTDHDPILLFDTIKLSVDNDKAVPINMKADDLDRMLSEEYPRIVEQYKLDGAVTAKTIYAAISKDPQISISYDGTVFVTAQSKFAVATWTGAKCVLAASVDIKGANAEVSGRCPGNCFPLDFGDKDTPDTWLPADTFGSLVLDLLSSSDADNGDTAYIVVQQLRKY